MSSRTAKILNLAKLKYNEDQSLESFSDIESDNIEIVSNVEEINLSGNFLLNEALTPKNIADMIENAEIVFAVDDEQNTNEKTNYENNDNSQFEAHQVLGNSSVKLVEKGSSFIEAEEINDQENVDQDYVPPEIDDSSESSSDNDEESSMDRVQEQENNDAHIRQDMADNNEEKLQEITNNPGKKKKTKGVRKREINQKLRLTGKKFLGFRKPAGQKNSFHDTERNERIMGIRCKCIDKSTKSEQKRRCYLITEQKRKAIFEKFWSEMSWDQRKVFVAQSVVNVPTERPKKSDADDKSRRSTTLKYSLTIGNNKIPVCKQMFLHTTGLKEWSVRNWSQQSTYGMTDSNSVLMSKRRTTNYHEEDTTFLKEFLESLNKLPSHYTRKDTDRLYLEQQFQSFAELHREYSRKCKEINKIPQSITSLQKAADNMKISLFHPRKDMCDTCFKYKNQNLTEEEYQVHISKKNAARNEKERDKNNSIEGNCNVITMDVQAVKLAPCLAASALYYRTKLCNHNSTIYNLKNQKATCYWFDETNADGQAATYASFLVDYLENSFLQPGIKLPIIIYSDGCTAQNRNSIMSKALLHLSEK
ncbi:unnamed protein product [Ceutorhynchus assimilis]|uniref:Uncharacterized protein n=1 Tax=Ceutorhynchus assimilis TaxID=467358 RepID=A0A9N9QMV1_9CUCU|nr:unnamed protein product [Ceutorhynchus assimilis]